jgi:hypothetical protein
MLNTPDQFDIGNQPYLFGLSIQQSKTTAHFGLFSHPQILYFLRSIVQKASKLPTAAETNYFFMEHIRMFGRLL